MSLPANPPLKPRVKQMALFLACFMLGYLARAIFGGAAAPGGNNNLLQIRESSFTSSSPYRYIDPLLACSAPEKNLIPEFLPLKNDLNNRIQEQIKQGNADQISIYFDTRDSRWLTINADEKYFPASLMKVPTMIAFLKAAESNPALLDKKVTYDGSYDLNAMEYFKPSAALQAGQAYTIKELLEHMIIYSDNNALPLLVDNINANILGNVYADLGINIPDNENNTLADYITIKSYANFFRVLYNASYLNRDMSELALEMLGKPDFPGGIEAGVPNNIIVAQKFGERSNSPNPSDPQSQKQLHDCGIIYYPKHPYLLCIMTKGRDYDKLASAISGLSKIVFEYVQKNLDTK